MAITGEQINSQTMSGGASIRNGQLINLLEQLSLPGSAFAIVEQSTRLGATTRRLVNIIAGTEVYPEQEKVRRPSFVEQLREALQNRQRHSENPLVVREREKTARGALIRGERSSQEIYHRLQQRRALQAGAPAYDPLTSLVREFPHT